MKRSLVFAAASLALLSGCAGRGYGTKYRVEASPAFSQDAMADLDAALADWSSKVPVTFDVRIGTGADCSASGQICVHPIVAPDSLEEHGAPADAAGFTDIRHGQDGGDVWIRAELACGGLFGHELGHAMGLVHEAESEMAPSLTDEPPGGADCRDILQWYSLRGRVAPNCESWSASTWAPSPAWENPTD
jgi:hypothetical protein